MAGDPHCCSAKTYLYDKPEQQNKGKRYLVRGDEIRVTETRSTRVRAIYLTDNNRQITGWIDSRDLFSDQPPQK